MPELIDRQSALSVCKEYGWIDDEVFIDGYNTAINDIRKAIKELSTIEAEPVRHGRWIIKRDEFYTAYNMYYAECSECKHTESTGMTERLKYCPQCGAKMDGGADNG